MSVLSFHAFVCPVLVNFGVAVLNKHVLNESVLMQAVSVKHTKQRAIRIVNV